MQPGVYRGLPNADYHAGEGTSKSMLDLAAKSPAKLRRVRTNPKARKQTASHKFGTAFHCLMLEPAEFLNRYCEPFAAPAGALVTVEDIKKALTEGGVAFKQSSTKPVLSALVREHLPGAVLFEDARAAWEAENADREEIEPDDWQRLHDMRDAVMAHPAACALLSAPGESELSAYWTEPVCDFATGEQLVDENGEPVVELLRVRPDYWRHDGVLVDLKFTSIEDGASREAFARHVDDFRYHVQHAMYLRGAHAAMSVEASKLEDNAFAEFAPPKAFAFLVVEDEACVVDGVAMGVAVWNLDEESVAEGVADFLFDLATVARCRVAKKWPGYSERIESLSLPGWSFTKGAARRAA
jgi:exodeoxyribonuclease VIII